MSKNIARVSKFINILIYSQHEYEFPMHNNNNNDNYFFFDILVYSWIFFKSAVFC